MTVDAAHESDIGRNPLPSRSPEKTCKKDDFLGGAVVDIRNAVGSHNEGGSRCVFVSAPASGD